METVPGACLRVFSIPELVQPICAYALKQDITRLSQVSRQLFYNVSPYVWETVNNVVALALLIPGASIMTYVADPLPALTVMQFPKYYDLSRFNIYAPYVREIKINPTLHIDEYDNWGRFLAFTRSRNLLPNLQRMRLVPPLFDAVNPVEKDIIRWATVFLSTSLRTLWIAPETRTYQAETTNSHFMWTTLDNARVFLQLAYWRCPMLDTLAILPGDLTVQKMRFLSDIRGRFSECSPLFPLFPPFQNLRTLTTSPSCLEPKSFAVLSSMPFLESLSIKGLVQLVSLYGSDVSVPDDAFPSLRHLELTSLRWETVFHLCNLKPLVRNLITLRIHATLSYPEAAPNYGRLAKLLSDLARIGSPLTELSVANFTRAKFYPEVLEQFRYFPLVKLSIRPTEFSNLPLETLSSALPFLEVLHFLPFGEGLHVKQLRTFTALFPRLRNLSVFICRSSLHELTDEDLAPAPGSHTRFCLESYFIMHLDWADVALKLARFDTLYYLLERTDGIIYAGIYTFCGLISNVWMGISGSILDLGLPCTYMLVIW
ncbi:hypothetical protein RSOL_180070 [Rhizoctonia solani AG-3 Rhs1AP]|uniref:F-box domain-containing protein n=1 Tax=Rhizoctonia solani AG-3 Rhs1AP TaxID=1086054 RepID=X8J298_9AGAM|nr:hypothetical protein RSOL_180070 [Rhizoctonia solani AG-3 Rhs1AP]